MLGDITNRRKIILSLPVVLAVALIFQMFSISEPITGDASLFSSLQREMVGEIDSHEIDLKVGVSIWHPMLYQNILFLIGKTIGTDLVYARFFGIFCFILNCLLIFSITSLLFENRRERDYASVLSVSLYALNPLGLQLAMHIDIDNSVLSTVLLLNVLCFLKISNKLTLRNTLLAALCFSLSLWCKLTTPLLLPPAFFLYFLFQKKYRQAFLFPSAVFLIGGAVFFSTWVFYCSLFDFPHMDVFYRIVRVFLGQKGASLDLNSLSRLFLTVSYWFSPYLLILFGFVTLQQMLFYGFGKEKRRINFIILFGCMIFLTYFFIGELTYGVPKYHYPALPLIAIVISFFLVKYLIEMEGRHILFLLISSLAIAVYFFLIGDPLYHLNFEFKKFLFESNLPKTIHNDYLKVLLKDFGLYILLIIPIAFFVFLFPQRTKQFILLYFLSLTFGNYFGMDLLQAKANYNTIYSYGGTGTEELLTSIEGKSRVLLIEGAIYTAFNRDIELYACNAKNKKELIYYVKRIKPDYLISGLSLNTLDQLQSIFQDRDFRNFMSQKYTYGEVGTYYYWKKDQLK